MSRNHKWFGTTNDTGLIVAWLREAGATLIGGGPLEYDGSVDGREFAIHFPSIGPIEFWPTDISPPECADNSPRAKHMILAMIKNKQNPDRPQIDVDRSAVAGLQLPEFRDGRYWVSGQVWFPTSLLQETFPELNRVCQKFERFLGKHTTVFDNRKGEDQCGYGYQLCMGGVIQKVVALPEALALLKGGAFMVDSFTSQGNYSKFRRRLQLSGHEPLP